MYISEGSYVNEGDLVAHIKSTDIDMQQDNLESQLKIYPDPAGPSTTSCCSCVQDDTNYFSETNPEESALLLSVRDLQEPGLSEDL